MLLDVALQNDDLIFADKLVLQVNHHLELIKKKLSGADNEI